MDLPSVPNGHKIDMSGYNLVWNDEFDGDKLDLSKWHMHCFSGKETEVRRGGYWNMSLASVYDSSLHIKTKYLENGINSNNIPGWYTCAIDTNFSYKPVYGYYECRCILPKGTGLWAAFWLWADTINVINGSGVTGNEVDIFESAFYFNEVARNSVQGAIHYDGYGEAHQMLQTYWAVLPNDPYKEFNTYGLEWNEDCYVFYLNGVEVARSTFGGICTEPSRIILSVEIDGENGIPSESWAGPTIEKNAEPPTDFTVDYVRVYQKQ